MGNVNRIEDARRAGPAPALLLVCRAAGQLLATLKVVVGVRLIGGSKAAGRSAYWTQAGDPAALEKTLYIQEIKERSQWNPGRQTSYRL
jgi:hypothetical protein